MLVSHYARTVKGKKILKTDFYSCHSEALQDYEFDDVAWAICSQEHLPSNHFVRADARKPYKIKKLKKNFWIRMILRY